jgi:hypothetical protein
MKVAYVDPSKPIRDPATMRPGARARHMGIDAEGKALTEFDVPETSFWIRRVLAGELRRLDNSGPLAPIAPLTKR